MMVVAKQHIATFAEPDKCLAVKQAQLLLDILVQPRTWEKSGQRMQETNSRCRAFTNTRSSMLMIP